MKKLLQQLNGKQREAVLQTEGPVLVLAGAGSGKTRALTFRVAYLVLEKKIPPKNILAVTFTNKAAGEMMARVKKLLGLPESTSPFSQYLPHVGTFHSICVRILRKEIEKIGYKRNFVIYDDQDQLAVMKRAMKEAGVSAEQIKPQAILHAISDAKNKLIDFELFAQSTGSFFEDQVSKCFTNYQGQLKKADAVDFDDIILLTVKIFKKYPDILERYQDLFRYILVDEYQDTNHAQYTFLKMLSAKRKNICVVGDDWQSIYGWRGADVRNILEFEKDYPDAKVVMLEQNYRSTQNILDAAHGVISRNVNRKDKTLWTDNGRGDLLVLHEARDEKDEARFVVERIGELKKERGYRLDDFAVLYRTNAQSRALEEAFLKAGIPYKIVGGVKFYQRKEIKDILAYLHFIQNPNDRTNFERIINEPKRGLGQKTVGVIFQIAESEKASILSVLSGFDPSKLADGIYKIAKAKSRAFKDFVGFVAKMSDFSKKNPVSKLIDAVYRESGYEAMLAKGGEEGMIRHENVQELLTVAKKYDGQEDGLEVFLEEVALVSQTDRDLEAKEMVPLMTLHSAKGLEYDVIFVVGMEEGLLPHSRAVINEKEMEEERRLCYVGITRAKKQAHLLYTSARSIYGSTQISIRSRFLDEIDSNLFETSYAEESVFFFGDEESFFTRGSGSGRKNKKGFIRNTFDPDFEQIELDDLGGTQNEKEEVFDLDFKDGEKVSHPDFGNGVVISQDEKSLQVAFAGAGLKKLLKGVAPLKKIG